MMMIMIMMMMIDVVEEDSLMMVRLAYDKRLICRKGGKLMRWEGGSLVAPPAWRNSDPSSLLPIDIGASSENHSVSELSPMISPRT